ncbi:MAG TPA: hypothetical protein VKB76_04325, partial [Ktedonobacterales bacterium]|nr:hypothetical protein [Ktedonobacterales bacterium]
RRAAIMENMRRLARLPHDVTWIEWEPLAVLKRELEEYKVSRDDYTRSPIQSGVLITRHPQIDTAFSMLLFGCGKVGEGPEILDWDTLGVAKQAIAWRADDGPMPWPESHVVAQIREDTKVYVRSDGTRWDKPPSMASFLTGCDAYDAPITLIETPHLPDFPVKYIRTMMVTHFMLARLIISLLATINDLPISHTRYSTTKHFVARGQYRKFLDHVTVTLTVPAPRYRALARKVVSNIHRRAHQVRGHWRENWRKPFLATCQHQFVNADEHTLRCSLCKGEKDWVTEHQRGDTSLGFVIHDYQVKANEQETKAS